MRASRRGGLWGRPYSLRRRTTTPTSEESSANSWFWVGAEIFANAPVTQWVVADWMTSGTVSLLYGKKDSYKSFVAISAGMASVEARL